MALADSISALDVVRAAMKTVPGIGSMLEGGVETLQKICEKIQVARANREDFLALAKHVVVLYVAVFKAIEAANEEARARMCDRVAALHEVLEKIHESALELSQRGQISALARSKSDKECIVELRKNLDDAARAFEIPSQLHTEAWLDEVRRICRRIEAKQEEAIRVVSATAELQARIDEGSRVEEDRDDRELLQKMLDPDHQATHYSSFAPHSCDRGTRVKVLDTITQWALAAHGPRVYWMTGVAGTGKSTISVSLCRKLEAEGCWVVSWFSSRDMASRRDPMKMGHTIAYQLSNFSERARRQLALVVAQSPPITKRGAVEQAQILLAAPLASMPHADDPLCTPTTAPPLIVIIDAIDECDNLARGAGEDLLAVLIPAICFLPGHAKLLLSSRGEEDLRIMFEGIFSRYRVERTQFFLHEVDRSIVRSDIQRYLIRAFQDIRGRHSRIPETWPTPTAVDSLVKLSDNLFVHAATAVRFIDDKRHAPVRRLEQLLAFTGRKVSAHETSPYSPLDNLYLNILERATDSEDPEASINTQIRTLLAAVLLLNDELRLHDLALLVEVHLEDARAIFWNLSAVLTYSDLNDAHRAVVRVFHPSFADFLVDNHRCLDPRFHVEKLEFEGNLASRCMKLMDESISTKHGSVRYARAYWPYHLTQAKLLPFVDDLFLRNLERLERWVESQNPNSLDAFEYVFPEQACRHLSELAILLSESTPDHHLLAPNSAAWQRGVSAVVRLIFRLNAILQMHTTLYERLGIDSSVGDSAGIFGSSGLLGNYNRWLQSCRIECHSQVIILDPLAKRNKFNTVISLPINKVHSSAESERARQETALLDTQIPVLAQQERALRDMGNFVLVEPVRLQRLYGERKRQSAEQGHNHTLNFGLIGFTHTL